MATEEDKKDFIKGVVKGVTGLFLTGVAYILGTESVKNFERTTKNSNSKK